MLGVYGCLGASLCYGYLYISEKKPFALHGRQFQHFLFI